MLAVHLVDNVHAAHALLHRMGEGLLGAHAQAGHAADDDAGRLHHAQGAHHLAHEVEIAGNVDNVEHLVVPVDGRAGGTDGALALDLFGLEVGHRGTILDLALAVNNARGEQHSLRQGGFAFAAMSHEGDVPDIGRDVFSHGTLLLLNFF